MYLPIVFFSYQMSIQQPTQNAGHCGVFFSCRRLQSLVFSLTQSHGHGYQVVIVHHRKPPFFFVHQFMRNPEMCLSSLVLTVFQKLLTTSRECRPHNTACLVWKSGLPRTYPRMLPIVGSSSEVNGCQGAISAVSFRLHGKIEYTPDLQLDSMRNE